MFRISASGAGVFQRFDDERVGGGDGLAAAVRAQEFVDADERGGAAAPVQARGFGDGRFDHFERMPAVIVAGPGDADAQAAEQGAKRRGIAGFVKATPVVPALGGFPAPVGAEIVGDVDPAGWHAGVMSAVRLTTRL
jgi:hypothetical protein